tara:strand:- start:1714 stop:2001 length:288 start_codon:yes stop_codon:yes gene_type:complete
MESIKISGEIVGLTQVENISEKLTKQTLAIKTDDKYPQVIGVEAINDKVDLLKGLASGQQVTAHCNLRGREYKGRYYISLSLWKLEAEETSNVPF